MTTNLLSVQGQQRRDEILTLALEESRRLQRRRKRRRRLTAYTAMVLIVAAAVRTFWSPAEPNSDRLWDSGRGGLATRSSSPAGFDLKRHLVKSEIDDLDEYLVSTHEQIPTGILLHDLELLHALADLGRVEGIVRMGGKTWLTSELDSHLAAQN